MIVIIVMIIIIAAIAAFSVQNASPVAVSFLSWHFESSLALVILLSLLAGIIIGMAIVSWMRIRRSLKQKKKSVPDRSRSDTAV